MKEGRTQYTCIISKGKVRFEKGKKQREALLPINRGGVAKERMRGGGGTSLSTLSILRDPSRKSALSKVKTKEKKGNAV